MEIGNRANFDCSRFGNPDVQITPEIDSPDLHYSTPNKHGLVPVRCLKPNSPTPIFIGFMAFATDKIDKVLMGKTHTMYTYVS